MQGLLATPEGILGVVIAIGLVLERLTRPKSTPKKKRNWPKR